MPTKKINLANISGKLSRTEMKNIMAGYQEDDGGSCGPLCSLTCTLSNQEHGHCHMPSSGTNAGKCFCVSGD